MLNFAQSGHRQLAQLVASIAFGLIAVAPTVAAAPSPDSVFTVGNYPVEAQADNAVTAKERALAEGQRAAFRSLLKRLVPVTAYGRLKQLTRVRAGDLIEGIRVRAERNSATDYIASLDFTFQARAVRDLLDREGIPFTDKQAPVLTVIPVWRPAADAPLKEEAAWTNVWRGLDLEHTLTPVKLAPLSKDMAPEAIAALAAGDGRAVRSLAAAARNELVIIALAEIDEASQRLTVTLSGRDAVGAFMLKRTYKIDAGDPNYASELAAVVSLGILEGRWKAINVASRRIAAAHPSAAPASPGEVDFLVSIEFRGMNEYRDIIRGLKAAGVEQLEVSGLSTRSARVTFRFVDGADRLAQVMERQGFSFRNSGDSWVLGAR